MFPHTYTLPMRSSWNSATSRHLLLAARRHHRQVVGSDVDADGNEQRDQAESESPMMMRAPPVRSSTMAVAMMTLAVGMQVSVLFIMLISKSRRRSWRYTCSVSENHGPSFYRLATL
jgi:hypothetical protein